MKIWVTDPNGENAVVLCDHGAGGPDGMEMRLQFQEQVQAFLRARSARVVSRGNALVEIRFSLHKQHASISAAQAYWFDRHAGLPWQGAAVFEFEDKATTRRLPLCTIGLTMPPPTGVLTREFYTIRGGVAQNSVRLQDAEGNPLFDSEGNALYAWEEVQ